MLTRTATTSVIPALAAVLLPVAAAGDVFVHYMIQGLNPGHGAEDVNSAHSLGFTGFALNVGQPGEGGDPWSPSAIADLFAAAEATSDPQFKLFFSMDLLQTSDPYAFVDLINNYTSSSAYYTSGPNSLPFVSTFSNGDGTDPSFWPDWKQQLNSGNGIYFVPNFDQVDSYYTDTSSWFDKWSSTVDGLFSWETSWPTQSDTPTNVSTSSDEPIISLAHEQGKPYMMPLSSLQFKHYRNDDGTLDYWYRAGEVVLPQRMTEILSLSDRPDIVQIQTWNDAGESHYIGPLWEEGLTDQITAYANATSWDHTGWQPILASFAAAFASEDSVDATGMVPPSINGSTPDVVGAMWYHSFLTQTASCSSVLEGEKPDGSGASLDAVNWATVLSPGIEGYAVQVWSGGNLINHTPLTQGLNYGSVPGMVTGEQYVEVIDADENIIISGKGGMGVTDEPDSTVCNYNYQVAGMV